MARFFLASSAKLAFAAVLIIVVSFSGSASTLSLEFVDASFAHMFETIGEVADWNVVVDSSVQGTGSIKLSDVTIDAALAYVSKLSGFEYRVVGATLLVASAGRISEYESTSLRYVEYVHASPEEIRQALRLVDGLQEPFIQPEGQLVILRGTPTLLDSAEDVIRNIDKPKQMSVDSRNKNVLQILHELSAALQVNLIADPELESKYFSVQFHDEDPWEIVQRIAQALNLHYDLQHNTLVVTTAETSTLQERERVKVYRLNYASPQLAKEVIRMILPEDRIVADKTSVMVRATASTLSEIDELISDLDFPQRQVLIEAWVQEIAADELRTLGIEWRGTPSFAGPGDDTPTFLELEWKPWELFLALKALEEQDKTKLLARPQIATIDGEEASIFIGDRIPIKVQTGEDSEEIVYFESGITLRITPRVSEDGYITTRIRPEVSTFLPSDTELPRTRTREAETTVRVRDGQPIVIGGLIQEQFSETITGIPFVSKLPILGRLFQWTDTESTQSEMVIFMIPRIIDGSEGIPTGEMFYQPIQKSD